jgi:hypothetical protein
MKTHRHSRCSVALATLSMLLSATSLAAAQSGHPIGEQRHFSAEDTSVSNPASIPPAVMAILAQDELVKALRPAPGTAASEAPPANWFLASQVPLGNPGEAGLIVIGTGPLTGPNIVMFWLFRLKGGRPQLLLRTGGHDLILLPSHSHGLADVETESVTTQRSNAYLFRFDGTTYQLAHQSSRRIH